MVKVLSEISKKLPLAHCTMIRPLVVGLLGTLTEVLPELGTLDAIVEM